MNTTPKNLAVVIYNLQFCYTHILNDDFHRVSKDSLL